MEHNRKRTEYVMQETIVRASKGFLELFFSNIGFEVFAFLCLSDVMANIRSFSVTSAQSRNSNLHQGCDLTCALWDWTSGDNRHTPACLLTDRMSN